MSAMSTTTIHIRRATQDDNVLLAELGAATFFDSWASDNTPQNMAAYMGAAFGPVKQAAELADPASVFFVAEAGGDAVGYARLHQGAAPAAVNGARPIQLVRIYARAAWTGQGVGAELLRACLDEAARRGCDTMWLAVWERNPRAIGFYRRWGFTEIGSHPFRLGDDLQTDILMQRAIA